MAERRECDTPDGQLDGRQESVAHLHQPGCRAGESEKRFCEVRRKNRTYLRLFSGIVPRCSAKVGPSVLPARPNWSSCGCGSSQIPFVLICCHRCDNASSAAKKPGQEITAASAR